MNAPMDPLYDFRSDGYGLDDARRARMRAKVLDAIPDDASTSATGLAPVATVVRPEPWRTSDIDLTGAQTLETVPDGGASVHDLPGRAHPDVRDRGRRPSRTHWSTSRRLLVAATVAVAIGLLAVVAGTSRSSDRQAGTLDGGSAPMTLDQLAAVALKQVGQPLAPGQYEYVRTSAATPDDVGGFNVDIDDGWHTTDGSGAHRSSSAKLPPGAVSTRFLLPRPAGDLQPDSAGLPTSGTFSYEQIQRAPTDPSALADAVRQASPPDQPDWAIAEQIAAFAGLTATPPAVRAAGIRALADLGFRPIGLVTDPLGRPAMGYQAATADGVEVLAFDQETGQALSYWSGPDDGSRNAATATRWGAWSGVAVTDRIG